MSSAGVVREEAPAGAQAQIPHDGSQPSPGHEASGHGFHEKEKDNLELLHEELDNFPSEEEIATLRRVSARLPLKAFSIAFIEACERFSYYGCVVLYANYIQQKMPPGSVTGAPLDPKGQAGALGMGQQAMNGITTFNQFWQYFMPLFGAWIADEYLGRFKTICIALAIDLLGHVVLITSALPPVLTKPSENSLAALIIAILLIGFGTGGFKPNISPLIAEQLEVKHLTVRTEKSGERVIVDPAITINRIYNWFYMFINIGSLIGQLGMVYAEKYVGFWLAYTLPAIVLSLGPLVMWLNRNNYDRVPPSGSVLVPALRLFGLANKGRWSINPWTTWKNLHDGTMWENVKPSKFTNETRPKWMNFDDAWVDEVHRGFNACAVFLWYPLYWLTYNQINNNLTSQAAVMTLNGLPNDVLNNLNPLSLIILIPLCDFIIYPALRRRGIRWTPIKRITAGFYVGSMAMIWALVIQYYIYQKSECGYYAAGTLADGETQCAPVDINVWAQTGSYVLIGLSEVFASITSLEYAFSKAPKSMRSFVQAVALFAVAFSAALGQALNPLTADPLLVWNYAVAGILAFIGGTIFWFQFRALDKAEDVLNELPEGKAHGAYSSDEEGVLPPPGAPLEKA